MAAMINGSQPMDSLVVPAPAPRPRRGEVGGRQFDEHLDRAMDTGGTGRSARGDTDRSGRAHDTERPARASGERQRIERVAARHRRTDQRDDGDASNVIDATPARSTDEPVADAPTLVETVGVDQPVDASVAPVPMVAATVTAVPVTAVPVTAVPEPESVVASVESVIDEPAVAPAPPVGPATPAAAPAVATPIPTPSPDFAIAVAVEAADVIDGAGQDAPLVTARSEASTADPLPAQAASEATVAPVPQAQPQVAPVARLTSGTSPARESNEGDAPPATAAQPDQATDASEPVAVITAVDAMRAMRATIAKPSGGAAAQTDDVVGPTAMPSAGAADSAASTEPRIAPATAAATAAPTGAFAATGVVTGAPSPAVAHSATAATGAPIEAGAARPAQADGLPVSLPSLSMDLSDEGLGPLTVHASTTSSGLHLKLTAGDRTVGDLLSRAGSELRRDLEAGGTRVGSIDIAHDASPPSSHGGSSNDRPATAFADQGQSGRRPSSGSGGAGSTSPLAGPVGAGRLATHAAPIRTRPIVGAEGVDVRI